MSLKTASQNKAVELDLVEPIEAIWPPKWKSDEQRMAFICALARMLNTDSQDDLETVYRAVIRYHSLQSFPTISHIMDCRDGIRSGRKKQQDQPVGKSWGQMNYDEKLKRSEAMERFGTSQPHHADFLRAHRAGSGASA